MTVAELIEKLSQVDPTLIVCVEDGEIGLDHDVTAYEITADVERRDGAPWFVDYHLRYREPEHPERVIILTRHGGHDETDQAKEL